MAAPVDLTLKPTKTFVLCPRLKERQGATTRLQSAQLEEATNLALAIEVEVMGTQEIHLSKYSPATLMGSGLVEELNGLFSSLDIELVIVDHPLSPVQQRNLERTWKTKVIDRTGLILEIFGKRARTAEGVLQVELAALQYQRSRLVRSWTHLERQRGGFGFTGGPGESQLELDRRLIDDRILKIKKDLEKTVRTRRLQRHARTRVPYPIVALVGYTNAGKSTLFNKLTGADVFAKDLLFATLDPTMRQLKLPSGQEIILSDTVGFISHLPTTLIAAFRATLEEVLSADLILHVRDISHKDTEIQKNDVDIVLKELGLEEAYDKGKIVEVWNKMDLVEEEPHFIQGENLKDLETVTPLQNASNISQEIRALEALETSSSSKTPPTLLHDVSDQSIPLHPKNIQATLKNKAMTAHAYLISATTGQGLDHLKCEIDKKLKEHIPEISVSIPAARGDILAWCYAAGGVIERKDEEEQIHLILRLPPTLLHKFWTL